MIARIFLVSALAISAPVLCDADELAVQSGEHSGFTRLVATVPLGAEWSVQHINNEVSLKVNGQTDGFDITSVFDFIPKSRIGAISGKADQLKLQLNCDCRVSAFLVKEQFVVIDVASPGTRLQTPLIAHQRERNKIQQSVRSIVHAPNRQQPILIPLLPLASDRSQPGGTMTGQQVADLLAVPPPSIVGNQVLSDVQQRLVRELGFATTRGLLDPAPGRQPVRPTPLTANEPSSKAVASKPPVPESEHEPNDNLRITSSMDLPKSMQTRRGSLTASGQNCPDESLTAVEDWGTDDSFAVQISAARANLYEEFDRIDTETALGLARTYIYFGFGAEARQVMSMDPTLASEHAMISEMANILEYGAAKDQALLLKLRNCNTSAALWAALGASEIPTHETMNTDATLRALNKLPMHLRQILAPMLSRRLLAYGNTSAAAAALRSLERSPEALQPDAVLAQANVKLQDGNTVAGQTRLQDVVAANAASSPEALVTLVDSRLKADQPVTVDTADLVEAYAQELRHGPLGPELRRVHVLALAKSGQFDRAFNALADLGGREESDAAVQLRLQLLEILTEAASDIVFLDYAFRQSNADIARLDSENKLAFARRLLSLGFAGNAQEVLATLPVNPLQVSRQLLEAEAALNLQQPLKAQAALVGIDQPEADLLRGDAKRMIGQNDEAHALYSQAKAVEAAAQAAWLAKDWRALTPEETPVFGRVAALDATGLADPIPREGMLAKTAAALAESELARNALANLLDAPQLEVSTQN